MPNCNKEIFSTLIGNPHAKTLLKKMVKCHRVPQALLFHGPDGIGKSQFALALTSLLMGEAHLPRLLSQNHPDLFHYVPEGKSMLHPMEKMRELIEEASLPPFEAPVKVFIIHDAHQMLPFSSNALLKTLEEPLPTTYFILLTHALEELLPTISSRCHKVPFFSLAQEEVEAFIQTQWDKSQEDARRLAFHSQGSLGRAKELQGMQFSFRQPLLEILSLQLPRDYPQFLKWSAVLEEIIEKDREGESSFSFSLVDILFDELIAWYRDKALLNAGLDLALCYHKDAVNVLGLKGACDTLPPLDHVFQEVSKSRLSLKHHIKLRVVLENLLLRLMPVSVKPHSLLVR